MSRIVVLGTDTEAGKTTLCALMLAAAPDRLAYWKPLQTGTPDSESIRRWVPGAEVYPAVATFEEPVAPVLAAQRAGQPIPNANQLAQQVPDPKDRVLLIETFGGPLSPLTEDELQVELLRRLRPARFLLVTPSRVGAVGRSLQAYSALVAWGIVPSAIVLLGPEDAFAVRSIRRQLPSMPVLSIDEPDEWTERGFAAAAARQREKLLKLLDEADPAGCPGSSRASLPAISSDLRELDRRCVWHPFTPLVDPVATVVVGAEDEFLILDDGRRVVDAIASWWTVLHGHRHPRLVAAAQAAMTRLDHVHFAGLTHPDAVLLAQRLLSTVNWPPGGRVFFSDNGSTAVEIALKLSFQYWRIRGEERRRYVGFEGGYHGDTFGAMAVSRDRVFFGHFEPLLFDADILPLDLDAVADYLKERGREVAAVVVEPLVQGAGGMRMHSPEVLATLARLTREAGALLVLDEVFTGCYRTGRFWAHEHAGIVPDLLCTAKALAGGMMPLAATLVAPHVAKEFEYPEPERTFYHGHTFTAHPIACAVALENLRMIDELGAEAVRRLEDFFKRRIAPLADRPGVRDVRILGNIAALELDLPGGYLAGVREEALRIGLEHGVLLRPLGPVLYAVPPWCCRESSLEAIAAAFEACAEKLTRR